MSPDRLIYMANQIGTFFGSQGHDKAVPGIAEHIRKGEDLPKPKIHRGRNYRAVRLPTLQTAKVDLYRVFSAAGIRKTEFARRLGISKGNVDRLFDLQNS